jgi:hypothetical protein
VKKDGSLFLEKAYQILILVPGMALGSGSGPSTDPEQNPTPDHPGRI